MTYDPSIGKWLSEDPIGFAAGDTNLYRYVSNSPLNLVDPTGLYEIEWEGNWPPNNPNNVPSFANRGAINSTFGRISARLPVLQKGVAQEISSLEKEIAAANSSCEKTQVLWRTQLKDDLKQLKSVLDSVVKGFASKAQHVELYHRYIPDNENHGDAKAYTTAATLAWDAEITFNTRLLDFTNTDEMDRVVFHEITHLYHTEDTDYQIGGKGSIFNNAEFIDDLMKTDLNKTPQFNFELNKARTKDAAFAPLAR